MTSDTPQGVIATGSTERPRLPAKPASIPHVGSGRAQLSLVEHALCPLDSIASLRDHLVHETTYGYRNRNGRLVMANVRVTCPSGLSAADEFTLSGLLALTFSQQEPSTEFHATPHYSLRQLGLIESNGSKGDTGQCHWSVVSCPWSVGSRHPPFIDHCGCNCPHLTRFPRELVDRPEKHKNLRQNTAPVCAWCHTGIASP